MSYVVCRAKITSPAPSPGMQAIGFRPNMECGARCPIPKPAEIMYVRCPLGHSFFADADQIIEDDE